MLKTLEFIFVVVMAVSAMRMLDLLPERAWGDYSDKEIFIRFFIDALPFIISVIGIITINAI